LAIEKLNSHKSPGIDQIPAELIKAGGRTIHSEIHKLIISIWNKEELPEEWKESITVPTYKGDKTDCSNYRGISLLPTIYKILPNILLSRLAPYAEEIIGDHQCVFHCSRSATDNIFYIRQILEKKWEYNEALHQLFIDFKTAYDSVRREVLYNILIEFGIPMKLVRLIKMCLTKTYSSLFNYFLYSLKTFHFRRGIVHSKSYVVCFFYYPKHCTFYCISWQIQDFYVIKLLCLGR